MDIELINITKRFGDFVANDAISLTVGSGQVLALLGENGAGKSTLMKVLFGLYQPDGGSILLNGKEVSLQSPNDAMRLGMGMVFQQFNLIPALSVLDNLLLSFPATPFWTFRTLFAKPRPTIQSALQILHRMAPDIDPTQPVADLSVGQRQVLELVKVLNLSAQCVILDEPTSVLTPQEASALWQLIREMANNGCTVILITHKMEDVMACADHVAVLRGGRLVKQLSQSECTEAELVQLMMGEQAIQPLATTTTYAALAQQPALIELRQFSARHGDQQLKPVSLQLRPGEILGIAGVSGSGQHLLTDAMMGLLPVTAGELIVAGRVVQSATQHTLGPRNLAYIPEQPAVNAVAANLDLTTNVALGHFHRLKFVPDWGPERLAATQVVQRFNVRPQNIALQAGQLSGGNLQKLVVGRELQGAPELIIAAYPTMGLDAGATQAVYQALLAKAEEGVPVLWISEDIDDLLAYSHRIAVMYHHAVVDVFVTAETDRFALGRAMTGGANSLAQAQAADMAEALADAQEVNA